jgi:dTDP-4-dehydrorhamnose reductase
MSTVVIAGAGGLLGARLAPALLADRHRVVGVGRTAKADWVADLCRSDEVERLFREVRPNIVINLAALTDVDACEREPNAAYRFNSLIVENLARCCPEAGVHLIQISTDQVYDGPGPHCESTINICNSYTLSKYAGEIAARGALGTILRTNFFGRSDTLGRTSLTDWLLKSLQDQTQVRVFDDVRFSPLSLSSLVKYLCLVVSNPKSGTFNLGSREGMSKADFAFAFASVMRMDSSNMVRGSSSISGLLARRPTDMRMNCAAFEAMYDLELPKLADEIEQMRGEYLAKC